MGVLKVRVGGAWVAVEQAAPSVPGTQGRVLYNNAGALAGATYADVDVEDMQLVAQALQGTGYTNPVAPAAGRWKIVNIQFGNASWPFLISPTGSNRPMFIPPSGVPYGMIMNNGSAGFTSGHGGAMTLTGTLATPSPSNVTPYTRTRRIEVRATSSVGGHRLSAPSTAMGSASTGFFGYIRFGTFQNATGVTTKLFAGLMATSNAATDVDPSTLTNMIGAGYDVNDTHFSLMHNDGSGAATKDSMSAFGTYFERYTSDGTFVHELILYQPPGVAEVNWLMFTHHAALFVGGVVTTDLPAPTTPLYLNTYVAKTGSTPGIGLLGSEFWTLY